MKDLPFTPPARCTGCGLKTKNMNPKGQGWLMVRLPMPGVALFSCSSCHTVFTNTDALANFKAVQEARDCKIQVVSGMSNINQIQGN